ncbi:MAG: hypothetical protein LBF08_06815 [Dysgonamonadaceae bacterium]|nr:hypothetical protein [Dysgonamonadaceae bacterium]
MKKIVIALFLFMSGIELNFGQESQQKNDTNLYTFFGNIVHEQFRFPLIGFVNIAGGNHNSPQTGFFNWNQNNFGTLQLSFVNTVGGDMAGFQMGFVNTVAGGMGGFQTGFINTVAKSFNGVQLGFVNTAVGKEVKGLQLGLINTTVNKFAGAQISFVNITKKINGLQFGFINYADSIEKGIPIGFLSIVRNGGYKAIEIGVSEISPFNLSFKIGVERFYTSFIVAYNPFREGIREQVIWGAGFGTIIQLGNTFYLNPEIASYNGINENFQNYVSVIPYFGYNIIPNLSIVAGPSLVWTYNDKNIEKPFYKIIEHSINNKNKLYLGARMGIRFRW